MTTEGDTTSADQGNALLLAAIRAMLPENYEQDDPGTADAHTLRRIHSVLHPGGVLWSGDIGKRECALWWFSFGAPHFSLHDSEEDAAEMAVTVEDGDECGLIYGLQFPDGHLVRAADWEALHRERVDSGTRRARQVQERADSPVLKHALRDPFNGGVFTVTSTSPNWPPAWVGSRPEGR